MLCITRDLNGTKNITIDGLESFDQYPFLYWIPPFRIVLSCALLNWMTMEGRIPFSFTNFITTPELSGPFYISPDIYHTQITEYLLLKFQRWALFCLLSSSKIFLIVIVLELTHFLVPSNGTGALWITSPVLFQPKIFLIYSDLLVKDPLYLFTIQHSRLICWRLLLSGLRSVLGNATDFLNSSD